MGARSRRKGAAWEREVGARLSEATGVSFTRNLEQVRTGGADLENELGFVVECKVGAQPPVWGALEQVQAARRDGDRIAFAVIRRNAAKGRAKQDAVVLTFDDFLELVRAARLGSRVVSAGP